MDRPQRLSQPPLQPDLLAHRAAQLIGQHGQRRGLRAGPVHINAAQGAYNKIEWSGSKDRRVATGHMAKTKI